MKKLKNLDFDFSDIKGNKEVVEKTTPPPLPKKKEETKKSGTVLTFRKQGCDSWISKDLTDCTAEEFVMWAAEVFPQPLEPKNFTTELKRIQGFNDILSFHNTEFLNPQTKTYYQ